MKSDPLRTYRTCGWPVSACIDRRPQDVAGRRSPASWRLLRWLRRDAQVR